MRSVGHPGLHMILSAHCCPCYLDGDGNAPANGTVGCKQAWFNYWSAGFSIIWVSRWAGGIFLHGICNCVVAMDQFYAVDLISPVVLSKQTDGKVKNIGYFHYSLHSSACRTRAFNLVHHSNGFFYGGWSAYRHQKIRGLVKWWVFICWRGALLDYQHPFN